jgi:exodeoxyribonuclease VII large subunit
MADAQGSQSERSPVANENVWSVGELNAEIGSVVTAAQDRFPSYVIGEISDINQYGFGTFFDLRDLNDDVTVSCIMWAPQRQSAPHDLTEGTETIVRATVDFYEDDGRTQLSVRSFWPVGESDRTADLAALRSELESEGLLDDAATQPLPEFPRHIGVVTSLAGSAREDFCEAVRARHPGVPITVCGATVQGDGAPASLVAGIQRLEQDPAIDVVVVTRGGGADADLWCFNAEPVVRAIADCTTPTVVAVGHEDDDTLAEAVADRRAMTPTDAGVAVAPDVSTIRNDLGQVERRIDRAYDGLVADEFDTMTQRLDAALDTVEHRMQTREATRQRVADLEQRITAAYDSLVSTRLTAIETRLDQAEQTVVHAAETDAVTTRAARSRVRGLETRIDTVYQARIDRELQTLDSRIEDAHREIKTDVRLEAGRSEARRLKLVVIVLLLVLGAVVLALVAGVI